MDKENKHTVHKWVYTNIYQIYGKGIPLPPETQGSPPSNE